VISQGILNSGGISEEGRQVILAVEIADTLSQTTWPSLFRRLKGRSLPEVRSVVSDDQEGIKAAVARHFQGASSNRCRPSATSSFWPPRG
jgi:transposase-like protein